MTLDSTTYTNVGLAEIPSAPATLSGLSLLKAIHTTDARTLNNLTTAPEPNNATAYRSAYYLATPDSINLADLSGCAIIFNDPPAAEFPGTAATQSATGMCPDVLPTSCIEALTARVEEIVADGGSGGGGGSCADLRDNLARRGLDECADFAGEGNGLGEFTVSSLAELEPLAGPQNASSDCWPVRSGSDGLAFLGEDVVAV
ncbi:hypothetical protein BJX64DRAFT_295158 [Aspergillus heterothallicus]